MLDIRKQLVDDLKKIVPEPDSALLAYSFLPYKDNNTESNTLNMNYLRGFVEGYLKNAMVVLIEHKHLKRNEASQICIEIRDWAFENWKITKNE